MFYKITLSQILLGLGEHRWLERKKTGNDKTEEEFEPDVTSEHRLLNTPAGLINLGNTCYVNSFLQIWFHNVWLRYKFIPKSGFRDYISARNLISSTLTFLEMIPARMNNVKITQSKSFFRGARGFIFKKCGPGNVKR